MRILGARAMLQCAKPKLVCEYWTTTHKCRKLMQCKTVEEVLECANINWKDDLSIWYGSNSFQVYPIIPEDPDDIELNDTNIVGDASPSETLWIVFEDDEWELVVPEEHIGWIKGTKYWDEIMKLVSEAHDNSLAYEMLSGWDDLEYQDIIQCDMEVN